MSFAKRFRFLRLSSARLAIFYMAVFSAGICTLLALVYFLTVQVLDRETDALIEAEYRSLHDDYHTGGIPQLIRTLRLRMDDWGRANAIYLLADARGQRIAGNISQWPRHGAMREGWFRFDISERADGKSPTHPVRGHTVLLPGGYRLFVGRDLIERQRFFQSLRNALLVGVGLCILLAGAIGFTYRWRVRRRVLAVVSTCAAVMDGDLSRRLTLDGSHDEFDELAAAVNRMLERIEQQTNTLRTTFDSAAHDLRAPLYRARVRLEDTLEHLEAGTPVRATMEATIGELERVQRTLGTLLQIAQAESQAENQGTATADPIDLAVLARELVELYQPEAGARRLELDCEAPRTAMIRGNRQLFAQALVNLLENSFKYVPAGGRVAVRVEATADTVTLEVADDGPGIPEAQRADMLKPFVRLQRDNDQLGSGLGLSLVAAVMRMHRATLELLDNKPGLVVRCRIAAAPTL
jgi:signal transduction histidine kinase